MARSAYKANISMSYMLDGDNTAITSELIKYVVVESLYESRFMPVIYVSLAVSNTLYNLMVKNEKDGKVYFNMSVYNAYSSTAIDHNTIKGLFTYIVSSSNPNYSENLATDTTADSAYKSITIALMSMDLLNKSKTSFNGIYGNIDQSTLMIKIMEGTDSIIKTPLYNPTYETIIIPPLNSRRKLIDFLYTRCPFYDTDYMFFLDFNRSYLLDKTGEALSAEDGELDTVELDIRSVTDNSAYYDGVEEKNGEYYLYINPANTTVTQNKSSNKIANQLVYVDDTAGTVDAVDLNINNNYDSDVKQLFVRGSSDQAVLAKNSAESNTIVIEVMKDNVDGSIFTPNKAYNIINYQNYSNYNGAYTLLYKKMIVKNTGLEFGVATNLGLRKVGNITSIGDSVVTDATLNSQSALYKYTSGSGVTTTTSANYNVSKSTKAANSSNRLNSSGTVAYKDSSTTGMYSKPLPNIKRFKASPNMSLKRNFDTHI